MSPMQAAFNGMREISSAVVAMTITLAAVFAPLAFTGGLTGSLFREFAVTLAGSVIISGIVALTITPMMSARISRPASTAGSSASSMARSTASARLRTAGSRLAQLPAGDADDRHCAGRRDRLHVHQDIERTGARRGPGLADVDRDRAALRDLGLHRPLCRPDCSAWPSDLPETRAAISRPSPSAAKPISAFVGLAFKDWAERERSQKLIQAGYPGPHRKAGGRRGARIRAADPAGLGRRPADLAGHPARPAIRARSSKSPSRSRRRRRLPAASSLSRTRWPSTRRRSRSRSTATAPPRSTCRSATSARRSTCWSAAAPSRSSTAIPTATTSSCRCRRNIATIRRSSANSTCAASPARWCRCRRW